MHLLFFLIPHIHFSFLSSSLFFIFACNLLPFYCFINTAIAAPYSGTPSPPSLFLEPPLPLPELMNFTSFANGSLGLVDGRYVNFFRLYLPVSISMYI